MERARGNPPPRAGFQAVRFGIVEDAVVPLVPAFETAADVFAGGSGLKAVKRMRKIVAKGVQLRREIVAFRFPLPPDQGGLFEALVQVVRDGPHVVEELAVDRPAPVLVPDCITDDRPAERRHGVAQRKPPPLVDNIAQPFILGGPFIVRGCGGSEPPLVDSASMLPQGIEVIRVKFQSLARLQEGPWHPRRSQPQQSFACIQGPSGHLLNLRATYRVHGRSLR